MNNWLVNRVSVIIGVFLFRWYHANGVGYGATHFDNAHGGYFMIPRTAFVTW